MKALGIDIGSLTTKAVLMSDGEVLSSSVLLSSDSAEQSAKAAAAEALCQAGFNFDNNFYVVTTGAGSKSVTFAQQQKAITTCLARGIHHLLPSVRMAMDLGAESITVIKMNDRARLIDWGSQDKCASGTGVFLQQMAKLMQMSLEQMSQLSLEAKAKADISSTCAVFAESEVISHVHRAPPTPREDIVAGIYLSTVHRLMTLCKRIGIEKDVSVVGGVALNSGLVSILEQELGFEVLVPDMPQTCAALGAAILASDGIAKGAS